MREKDDPFVADELVEIDGSICRLGLEVGRYATQAQAVKGQLQIMDCRALTRQGEDADGCGRSSLPMLLMSKVVSGINAQWR